MDGNGMGHGGSPRGRRRGHRSYDTDDAELLTVTSLDGKVGPLLDYNQLAQANMGLIAQTQQLQRRLDDAEHELAVLRSSGHTPRRTVAHLEDQLQSLLESSIHSKAKEREMEKEISALQGEVRDKGQKIAHLLEELKMQSTRRGSNSSYFRSLCPPNSKRESHGGDWDDSIGVVQALQEECAVAKERAKQLEEANDQLRRRARCRTSSVGVQTEGDSLDTPRRSRMLSCDGQSTPRRRSSTSDEVDVEFLRLKLQEKERECANKDIVIKGLKAILPKAQAPITPNRSVFSDLDRRSSPCFDPVADKDVQPQSPFSALRSPPSALSTRSSRPPLPHHRSYSTGSHVSRSPRDDRYEPRMRSSSRESIRSNSSWRDLSPDSARRRLYYGERDRRVDPSDDLVNYRFRS